MGESTAGAHGGSQQTSPLVLLVNPTNARAARASSREQILRLMPSKKINRDFKEWKVED